MRIDIIVTRHPTLVTYLIEQGLASPDTPVVEHARPDDVRDRHVLGVLPNHLGSIAASITEIPMRLTKDDRAAMQRGDLPLEVLRRVAGRPVTYRVTDMSREDRRIAGIAAAISVTRDASGQDPHLWMNPRGNLIVESHCSNFASEVEESTGYVRHYGFGYVRTRHNGTPSAPQGDKVKADLVDCAPTPWLDARHSTGRLVGGVWVGESSEAIKRGGWRLEGRGGFVVDRIAHLTFTDEDQAWAAAELEYGAHPLADGADGVSAIVGPVRV